jgi:hypothetical protein
MIKRGFWVALGAIVGVTGYRKATRVARAVTGQPAGPRLMRAGRPVPVPLPTRLAIGARGTARLVRDVRADMAEYRAAHEAEYRQAVTAEHMAVLEADQAQPANGANGSDLHSAGIGRSLGNRSLQDLADRARPDPSPRGPRES